MGRRVDAGDRYAEAQVDVVLGVPLLRVDVDRLPFGFAEQVVLRQGRPLIRPFALRADKDERAVEALRPERLRRFRPGEARSGDHVCHFCAHGRLLCSGVARARRVAAS